MKEEVFGPVLPVSAFDTVADAIDMANATRFGLGASIWTHDMRTISQATRELDAGIVWVNQHLGYRLRFHSEGEVIRTWQGEWPLCPAAVP